MSYSAHFHTTEKALSSLLRMMTLLTWIFVMLSTSLAAQNCGDTVYDPGGTGTYPNNANWSQTFTGGASDILSITFSSFQVESGYDYLYVYDGPTTSFPLLAQLSGSNLPSDITATGNQITLRFTSDGSVRQNGFELEILCESPPEPHPCTTSACVEEYTFSWYDGTSGAQWPITNGEATWSEIYTISGGQGDYMVTVTLDNPDGQNIDFGNCSTILDAAYTATCNAPNGNADCDGNASTNNSQFTYGCSFLTFGITSTNSNQTTSITYDFEHPAFICDFEIGDIDFSPAFNPNITSYQDEVDVVADSMGIPVILSAVTGSAVDVINNNTSNIKLLADYDNVSGGDVLPTDPRGRANITSDTRVTSITFTYSNGPEDDGLSDDHAIRLSGFSFCPVLVEICDNDLDDDGNGYADSFDPACPSYAPFNCDKQLYQSFAATSSSDYFLYTVQTDPVSLTQISNLTTNGMSASAFNSLAFNPIDRFLYGINPTSGGNYEMYRINSIGEVELVGNITGLAGSNEAGCMSETGQYYITGASGSLYVVDIATLQATLITNLGFTGFDLALSPEDGMLYIWDRDSHRLKRIDPVSGAVTNIGPVNTQYDALGALYFNEQGEIIAYGDDVNVTGTVQETLMKIDPATGIISPLGTGPSTNFNDGCSCAFGVGFDKSASASIASPGDDVTYTFTIYNNSGGTLTDVAFSDILPPDFVWSGEPFDIVGLTLGSTSVTGLQAATFQILSIPPGTANSFKLTTTIPSSFCGEISNQAQLSALPSALGGGVLSDNPASADISDATVISVNGCIDYFLEVECGTVGANWNEVVDATASGGSYLTINPPANSYNSAPSSPDDHITFDLDVVGAGTYNIFARVQAASGADDSFWVRANGGTWYQWNSWAGLASSWSWLRIYDTNNGDAFVTFDLVAGTNTIDIAYREDGARIDKISLAVSDEVPTGMGAQAINCPEICGNGIDDDFDGLTDCEDDDCAAEVCEGPCPTGSLLVQRWMSIAGNDIGAMTALSSYPDSPDEVEHIYSFDAPNSYGDNYGQRISGYIIPSETGIYSFNVTSDDHSEVYLSTSTDPGSSSLIANISGWAGQGNHTKYASQTSSDISLIAGKWYYVELLHKEGGGGDNAELYWKTPSNSTWTIIPGENLSPSVCIEICDNGIDDDLDGLIDCEDPDCSASVGATVQASASEICSGSSTDLTVNTVGAISGYVWSNSAGTSPTVSVSPASTTTYTVTVTNTEGCTATDEIQIVLHNLPTPTASNDGPITCADGTVTLSVAPSGLSYAWSGGGTSQTKNVTAAGTYTVTATDSNGCTNTAQTVVTTDLTPPVVTAGADDVICNGESSTLIASGAVSYVWSTGATSASIAVSPTNTTTYTVTGTAANGCTDSDDIQVTVNTNPIATAANNGVLNCATATVTLTATPAGMSYAWSGGGSSQTKDVTTAGTYTVTVTDSNGCTASAQTTVTDDYSTPTADAGSDQAICNGESTTLTASGGVSYAWSTGGITESINVSPSIATIYSVTVTGANGCTAIDQVQIAVNALPAATASNDGPITCADGTVTLSVAPSGLSYAWSGGGTSQTKNVTAAGTYTVTATDTNGCTNTAQTVVTTDLTPPVVTAGADDVICNGESSTLIASGAVSYLWSTGATSASIAVSPTNTTTYSVTGMAANGCTAIDEIVVVVNDIPVVVCQYEITGEDLVQGDCTVEVCEGEGLTLSADPNYLVSYQWDGPNGFSGMGNEYGRLLLSNDLTVSHSGDYTVVVTDSNGCTASNVINVTILPAPETDFGADPQICLGESVLLEANNGVSYSWSTGEDTQDITVAPAVSTSYAVTITGANGCTGVSSTTVIIAPDPIVTLTGPQEICIGEVTTFTPSTGGDWTSSDDAVAIISNSGNVVGVSGGFAVFTFEESPTGCTTVSDTIFVSPEMGIAIDFMGGVCLTDDSQLGVTITGGTPDYTYEWAGPSSFVSTDAIIDVLESGNYYVTVTDAFGCEKSTSGYVYERYDPFIFSLSTEVCEGEMVDLTVNSSTAIAYLWSANAGSSTASSVTVTPIPPVSIYTVTITNDLGCESVATVSIDVNEKTDVAVTGPNTICEGETTTLSPTSGGTWTSTNNSIATASPGGLVTGVNFGSVSFIFIDSIYACSSDPTSSITVVDLPDAVYTGSTVLCEGETTTLSPTTGGTWTSSDTSVATITDNGQVSGVGAGTASFTFENTSTGCVSDASADLTIHTVYPVEITGDTSLCVGENTYLTPTTGGTWTSSDTDVATISNIGIVTAISGGKASFTFTSAYSCISPASQEITVTDITDMVISGPSVLCEGLSGMLIADVSGGVWSSVNGSIVSVDATTGEITAIAEGTTTITYAQDPELCINDASYDVSVLGKPSADLTGSASLCIGDISNVSSTATGGSWTSTDVLVAVVSDAGVVVGVSAGQAAFVYEGANGCLSDTTAYVTVHPAISVDISYSGGLCLEDDSQLTADVTGGSPGFDFQWTGPGGFASIEKTIDIPLSGNYTVIVTDNMGCSASYSAFVYSRYEPFIFTLNTEVCEGESVTLSINGSSGGTYQWGANAANSTDQTITVTPPVPSATYAVTVTNDIGCTTLATATIGVNPTPEITLTGSDSICVAAMTTLTSSAVGTWTSSNYSVASINNNGQVIGVNPGTAVFTFRDGATGCYSDQSEVVTVKPNEFVAILGIDDICLGTPEILSATKADGIWSSSNPSIATINALTGEITPQSAGIVNISYDIPEPLCFDTATKSLTVKNLPAVNINGPSLICEGDVSYLIPTSGGVWTSSDASVATVSNIGVITGISGGTTSFTFTSDYGCLSPLGQDVTVVAEPIITASGATELCINENTQLNANTSGIWISSNNQVASVSSLGLVLAKKAGTAEFTFIEFTNGCAAVNPIAITVHPIPSINGLVDQTICVGEATSITPATGGSWSSSNPLIASIDDAGLITGLSAGAVTFTYLSSSTGCRSVASAPLTVEGLPSITTVGPADICVGDQTNVQPSNGGTWSSSDVSIATITNQGLITGASNGSVRFTFTNSSTGCISEDTEVFTISNPSLASISGVGSMCMAETQSLTGSVLGSWSSSNSAIASIDAAGLVTAVAPGFVTIRLTPFEDCIVRPTFDIQVVPLPTATFSGSSSICINSTTSLSPTSGGVWVSSNTDVATVTNTGIVTAVGAGEATFTYTDDLSGCTAATAASLLVFDRPIVEISGDDEICIGGSTSMSPSTGGFWTSSNGSIASISTAGLITGVSAGQATFTFTESGTGCLSVASLPVTILPKPVVSISGDSQICPGETSQLAPSTGGSWISDNSAVATVSEGGQVTGISQGLARFTFVSDDGCPSNKTSPIIVFGAPTIIVPESNICIGEEIIASPISGGLWSSSDPGVATITNGGVITGVSPGTATFTFIDDNSMCASQESDPLIISDNPDIGLNGPSVICAGSATNLVPTTGGVWISLDTDVATINNSGTVTGVGPGEARFVFTNLSSGCTSDTSDIVTVNVSLVPTYLGPSILCIGDTTYLETLTSGTWSSSNSNVATVNASGRILSVGQGVAQFRFTNSSTGCISTWSSFLTVNGAPTVSLQGSPNICVGSTIQLTSNQVGTWYTSDASVAIVSTGGLVTGVAPGDVYFSFTDSSTGCTSDGTLLVTVQNGDAVALTGSDEICAGYTTTIEPSTGGFWISSNPAIASITNAGVITGKAGGQATFTFTNGSTGCITHASDDPVTVRHCRNHDFNVSLVNQEISGSVGTNDNMPTGSSYGAVFQTMERPTGSVANLVIAPDGAYMFTGTMAGNYLFKVPVCGPTQSSGCPTTLLEITVVDDVYSAANPVANIDIGTTYNYDRSAAGKGSDLPGMTMPVNIMANDKCVYTVGCDMDYSTISVVTAPRHGSTTTDAVGNIMYTPLPGYIGYDTIYYQTCSDDGLRCNTSWQMLSVNDTTAMNSVVAGDDFTYTIVGIPTSGNVLTNDSDPEWDALGVVPQGTLMTPVITSAGSFFIDALGNYTFTPDEDFSGHTEIIYTVCDEQSDCTNATIHMLVFDDIAITVRMYIEGALMNNANQIGPDGRPLMRDDLRVSPFNGGMAIPLDDPYTTPFNFTYLYDKYSHMGPHMYIENQKIVDSIGVFSVAGADAIVDWVHVELRSKSDNTVAIASRAGLLQRDGDVVDLDGVSPLRFQGVNVDSFYVVAKHRTHLAVMSEKVHYAELIDFTDLDYPVWDFGDTHESGFDFTGMATKNSVKSGYRALWSGDLDSNGKIKFSAPEDDQTYIYQDVLFTSPQYLINYNNTVGYYSGDYDMNSKAKYTNPNDDKNYLFSQLLLYPLNSYLVSNFNAMIQQVPPRSN